MAEAARADGRTGLPCHLRRPIEGAQTFESVFYRDPESGDWAETDLLILIGDVLLVIEAKAGAMPMQSPATNFASHERVIRNLIVDAYRQCKRFLEYLASAGEVALYRLVDGAYLEVGRTRRDQFRLILPIGLTVEAFTPFSAMAKELPEVQPILGKHPFISMSVDDLFVLQRFLPTTANSSTISKCVSRWRGSKELCCSMRRIISVPTSPRIALTWISASSSRKLIR